MVVKGGRSAKKKVAQFFNEILRMDKELEKQSELLELREINQREATERREEEDTDDEDEESMGSAGKEGKAKVVHDDDNDDDEVPLLTQVDLWQSQLRVEHARVGVKV
jgi:hypothetical protein